MSFRPTRRRIAKKTVLTSDKERDLNQDDCCAHASASCSSSSSQKAPHIPCKRRNSRASTSSNRCAENRVEDMALPLGMSIAAFVAQVLECSNEAVAIKGMAVDHLSMVCSSAVRESLSNTFGDRLNSFMANFENSFDVTLRTLRSVNRLSLRMRKRKMRLLNQRRRRLHQPPQADADDTGADFSSSVTTRGESKTVEVEEEEGEESGGEVSPWCNDLQVMELPSDPRLAMQPFVSTVGCLMAEVARHNDLTAERMRVEREHVDVLAVSNSLKCREIMQGVLNVSLKASRHKMEVEETGHREMRKACIDCLVAGLLIMSASLGYAAYIHSYRRIADATASCHHHFQGAKSWWMPTQVSSMKTGMHVLRCQVQVVSRMLFGVMLIVAVAYLLLQRSGDMSRTMPVTFILLLLGVACGLAGKLCVDTLGGAGYHWMLYWETLCLLHFVAGTWTSFLYPLLHGRVVPLMGKAEEAGQVMGYGFRRCFFYGLILLVLPLCCGLLPFAGFSEWRDHFWMLLLKQVSEF